MAVKGKKGKKIVTDGVAHVHSSFNNTIITITDISIFLKELKIPLKKVAIELNQEIIDKNNLKMIKLEKNDKIEIVHFIGGG